MRRVSQIGLAIATLLVLAAPGCRTSGSQAAWRALPAFQPSDASVAWSETDLQAARRLYLNKCARCHKFHDPAKYVETEWRDWMEKMSRKARLSAAEEEQLVQFLGLYRATSTTISNRAKTSY